jgi:hypothetical protein
MIEIGLNLEQSLGDILAACLQSEPVNELEATQYAGESLAAQIASASQFDFDAVWQVLIHLPDGYLRLLDSPEGWAAISAIVSAEMGVSSVPVVPVIH